MRGHIPVHLLARKYIGVNVPAYADPGTAAENGANTLPGRAAGGGENASPSTALERGYASGSAAGRIPAVK